MGVLDAGAFGCSRPARVVRAPACGAQRSASTPDVSRRQSLIAATAVLALAAQEAEAAECDLVLTPSGIKYCELKEGDGPDAAANTIIRAHYDGRLESNNVQFDASYNRGRPLTFKVGAGEVIRGWDIGILGSEGMPAMKAGGKRRLIIPPELGYGKRGAGGVIPPNAVLKFDVEYLGPANARR